MHRVIDNLLHLRDTIDKAEALIAWCRGFNRMDLKAELLDLVSKIDTAKVIKHLDDEILKKIPEKLI